MFQLLKLLCLLLLVTKTTLGQKIELVNKPDPKQSGSCILDNSKPLNAQENLIFINKQTAICIYLIRSPTNNWKNMTSSSPYFRWMLKPIADKWSNIKVSYVFCLCVVVVVEIYV